MLRRAHPQLANLISILFELNSKNIYFINMNNVREKLPQKPSGFNTIFDILCFIGKYKFLNIRVVYIGISV